MSLLSKNTNSSSPPPPLAYSLGAGDINKIVDAILPKLSPFFSKTLSEDEKYVALHNSVYNISKDKMFTTKNEFDSIVKAIVQTIVNFIINKVSTNSIRPDNAPCCKTAFGNCAVCSSNCNSCGKTLFGASECGSNC